jgi:hypothetical protein
MEVHVFQNKIKVKELTTNDTNSLLHSINMWQYYKFSHFLNPGIVYFYCYGAAFSTGDFLKID